MYHAGENVDVIQVQIFKIYFYGLDFNTCCALIKHIKNNAEFSLLNTFNDIKYCNLVKIGQVHPECGIFSHEIKKNNSLWT